MNLNRVLIQQKVSIILNVIFVLYAASFIVSSGLERLTIYLATLFWLLEGNYKEKLKQLISQKVILLYLSIILLFFISIFMSDSVVNGFMQSKYSNGYSYFYHKSIIYFLMAIYISTSLKKEYIKFIVYAFLLQVLYMVGNVYYLYFTQFINGDDFTYYIMSTNRIFYSIALNIGFMLICSLFYFYQTKILKSILILFMILIVFAILLLGSRAGILALIINMLVILIYFGKRYLNTKSLIVSFALISIIFVSSYHYIPQVKHRLNAAKSDIVKVYKSNNYNSSLGIRIALYETSFKLLLANPKSFIFGLGCGDAKYKFKKYLDKNEPNKAFISKQPHVHNQYLQTWIDGGLLAMIIYISLLIYLLKLNTPIQYKLAKYGFVSSIFILGFSDIIYHRGTILGLFAFGIGLFLAIDKYHNKERTLEKTT